LAGLSRGEEIFSSSHSSRPVLEFTKPLVHYNKDYRSFPSVGWPERGVYYLIWRWPEEWAEEYCYCFSLPACHVTRRHVPV